MAEPAMLAGYRALSRLAHPLAPPLLRWRLARGKEDPRRHTERYGKPGAGRPDGPLVWIHAASVGETVSILPLMSRILAAAPVHGLLTTGTLTSARIAETRLPERALHQFVPLDAPRFVGRFLDHWKPGLAIFAESELWPNMILQMKQRGAGLALVNARMSERSFRGWQRGAGMIAALLSHFDLCLAQSEGDARRLNALGAPAVACTGNLKFDVPAPDAPADDLKALSQALADRPRWTAASLHPGEDEIVLDAHRSIAERQPRLVTMLVPRHPERAPAIAELAASRGLSVSLRSRDRVPERSTDIFLIDTIGELGLVFRNTGIAFMGGSLIPHGGQNPIEAAKLGTAILHGPHVANFDEAYAALDAAGGAEEIGRTDDLAERVGRLIGEPSVLASRATAAETAVASLGGALDRTMKALDPLIAPLAAKG